MTSAPLLVDTLSRNSLRGRGSTLLDTLHSESCAPRLQLEFGTPWDWAQGQRLCVSVPSGELWSCSPGDGSSFRLRAITEGIRKTGTHSCLAPLLPHPGHHSLLSVGRGISPFIFAYLVFLTGIDEAHQIRRHMTTYPITPRILVFVERFS